MEDYIHSASAYKLILMLIGKFDKSAQRNWGQSERVN